MVGEEVEEEEEKQEEEEEEEEHRKRRRRRFNVGRVFVRNQTPASGANRPCAGNSTILATASTSLKRAQRNSLSLPSGAYTRSRFSST